MFLTFLGNIWINDDRICACFCTGWKHLVPSMVLVATAMLCKEQGITVTGVCVIYEIFIAQKVIYYAGNFPISLDLTKLHISDSIMRTHPHNPDAVWSQKCVRGRCCWCDDRFSRVHFLDGNRSLANWGHSTSGRVNCDHGVIAVHATADNGLAIARLYQVSARTA